MLSIECQTCLVKNWLTTNDIEGPYYIKGAPFTNTLMSANEPGRRLTITGRVLENNCVTPVGGVLIDVW